MRKYSRKVSFRVTPDEAKVIRDLCTHGEFHISAGELFRKLLAAEAKRRAVGRLSAS